MSYHYNPFIGNLDEVNDPIPGGLVYKGIIYVNTDFPLAASVQAGWLYVIGANVTDNAGAPYTNTGQSFSAGDEILWNGTAWDVMGGSAVIPPNLFKTVVVDPTIPEVAGKNYQSITNALVYVLTQTPSVTNKWGIKVGMVNPALEAASIDIPVGVWILGEKGVTMLPMAITSSVDPVANLDIYSGGLKDCEIQNLTIASGKCITLDNCEVSGGISAATIMFMQGGTITGGDFSTTYIMSIRDVILGGQNSTITLPALLSAYECNFILPSSKHSVLNGGYFYNCVFPATATNQNTLNAGSYSFHSCTFDAGWSSYPLTLVTGVTAYFHQCTFEGTVNLTYNTGSVVTLDGTQKPTTVVNGGGTLTAIGDFYDNSSSGLLAQNVQDAIDELALSSTDLSILMATRNKVEETLSSVYTVALTTSGAGDLQTAINGLVDGDILEIQTNATYSPITIPSGKSFTIKTKQGYSPVLTGANCITLLNGANDVVISGLIIDSPTTPAPNQTGSGICLAHQAVVSNIYFHNITIRNATGSGVMLSYHQTIGGDNYANPNLYPAEFSTRVCFVDCHFYQASNEGIEGANLALRGIYEPVIMGCKIDGYIAGSPNGSRGISLQNCISAYIYDNEIQNFDLNGGEGIKIDRLGAATYYNTGYVINNRVKHCLEGIDIDDYVEAVVIGNVCQDCLQRGISVDNNAIAKIIGNICFSSVNGILSEAGAIVDLKQNNCFYNTTDYSTSGYVPDSSNISDPERQIFPYSSDSIYYDNTISGLTSDNVKEAIDELAGLPSGVWGIDHAVIVDPNKSEIAGERYESITNALTYVNTQTPSLTNKWGIKVGAVDVLKEAASITIPDGVWILGEKGVTVLPMQVISNISLVANYDITGGGLKDCEIQNLIGATGKGLNLINCEVSGGTALGTLYYIVGGSITGGNFSAVPYPYLFDVHIGGQNSTITWGAYITAYRCHFLLSTSKFSVFNGGYFFDCIFPGGIPGANTFNAGEYHFHKCVFDAGWSNYALTFVTGITAYLRQCTFQGNLTLTYNTGSVITMDGCQRPLNIVNGGGTLETKSDLIREDSAAASASNVGSLRYRTSGNNSYVDMVMQTGAATYAWVNIVQNSW